MIACTISQQAGSGGDRVARLLAERAGVSLVDRGTVVARTRARGLSPVDEDYVPGFLTRLVVSCGEAAWPTGYPAVESRRREIFREAVQRVVHEAACRPCVVLGMGSFAILADHPSALHVRIRAPREWRVAHLASSKILSLAEASRTLTQDDRREAAFVSQAFGLDVDDVRNFHVVCDASRLSAEQIVALLLAACGQDAVRAGSA